MTISLLAHLACEKCASRPSAPATSRPPNADACMGACGVIGELDGTIWCRLQALCKLEGGWVGQRAHACAWAAWVTRARARAAQGRVGPAPDRGADERDAELGDGVQEVVPGLQAAHLLRQRQGAQGQAPGLVQAQRVPHLHHVLHARAAGARARPRRAPPPGAPPPPHSPAGATSGRRRPAWRAAARSPPRAEASRPACASARGRGGAPTGRRQAGLHARARGGHCRARARRTPRCSGARSGST